MSNSTENKPVLKKDFLPVYYHYEVTLLDVVRVQDVLSHDVEDVLGVRRQRLQYVYQRAQLHIS